MKFEKVRFDLETGRLLDDCNPLVCFGGGKGSALTPQPIYTQPPAAPAGAVEAAMVDATTPEDEEKMKKKAITQGAKSLQIPLSDSTTSTTVGTV
mgnify:CR=1 FL=1